MEVRARVHQPRIQIYQQIRDYFFRYLSVFPHAKHSKHMRYRWGLSINTTRLRQLWRGHKPSAYGNYQIGGVTGPAGGATPSVYSLAGLAALISRNTGLSGHPSNRQQVPYSD